MTRLLRCSEQSGVVEWRAMDAMDPYSQDDQLSFAFEILPAMCPWPLHPWQSTSFCPRALSSSFEVRAAAVPKSHLSSSICTCPR